MHSAIRVSIESKRGCGYRKPGGLYLISGGLSAPCGKLPIPLEVCPCCGTGIKPSRGWTWVNGTALSAERHCDQQGTRQCAVCPLSKPVGRVGLLWIGERFYATPADFMRETATQGVSRRISAVPKDFRIGETWVWIAHRKCIANADGTFTAGVFQAFRPQAIEYVVRGDETDEEIDRMMKRGISPVQVQHAGESALMF